MNIFEENKIHHTCILYFLLISFAIQPQIIVTHPLRGIRKEKCKLFEYTVYIYIENIYFKFAHLM